MARVEISIQSNIKQVLPQIKDQLSKKNFTFALAKTLTNLAQESQAQVKREMPQKFTIRRPWVVNGIRIRPATRDRLEAWVYSLDSGGRRDFMTRQEYGGIKTPQGGKHIAIPLKAVKPTKKTIIPQYMKPKSLLMYGPQKNKTAQRAVSRAAAFKIKGKKPGQEWIMIRKNGRVQPAWLLAPRATIDRTNFLSDPTSKIVKARANILLMTNIRDATRPKK